MALRSLVRRSVPAAGDLSTTDPITHEPLHPESVVLASDGVYYDFETLRSWCDHGRRTSPMTREVLRPGVIQAESRITSYLMSRRVELWSQDMPQPTVRFLWTPSNPETDCGTEGWLRIHGQIQARRWNTELGVALRTLLGWDDDCTVEWKYPMLEDQRTLALPSPVVELAPVGSKLAQWMGLEPDHLTNPSSVVCAWFRCAEREDSWDTMESYLIRRG